MNVIGLLSIVVALLNAVVAIAGSLYAFATIRGSVTALWTGGKILLVLLTLASPYITTFVLSYFGPDNLETAILSINLLIATLSLIVSILFVLVVVEIEQLKGSKQRNSDTPYS